MDDCCNKKSDELKHFSQNHHKILKVALYINLLLFFVEGTFGWIANSNALLADSLDMLGDAFIYGISIYAIHRSIKWNATVSIIKGIMMSVFGAGVLLHAIVRFKAPGLPVAETMGVVGSLALMANITCALLLLRHRNDNINMRSTWLCTRNDVLANVSVLIAAALVGLTQSKYPDLLVGIGIASLVLYSAVTILREARQSLVQ